LVPIYIYCLKCRKFGQLILSRIIETVASTYPILRLKCTKFDFGWGSAPDPAGEPLPDPLAGFKGPNGPLKREGEREKGEGRERKSRGGEKGRGNSSPQF